MRTLLVTGGAGFIGTNFVYYWLEKYPEDQVIVVDALTYAGNIRNLDGANESPRFKFVHADIRDQETLEQVLDEKEVDIIVHFAAESHVDRSIADPDAFMQTNILGTHSLLKAARNIWLDKKSCPHRFHHISTDEVYGTLDSWESPFSETTPYAPNSPYSASKASSDHLVRAYHETYGLEVTTSNCSNNYGPFQFPEKLIPLMVINILYGKPIPVYGDGLQIRDWLYVDDHNIGIDLILEKGIPGQTYNIGGKNEKANIDVVNQICSLMGKKIENSTDLIKRFPNSPPVFGNACSSLITHVTDRAGHDRRYAIDARKIESSLGYEPRTSFEKGIEQTIDWFLEQESWWKPLLER